MALATNIHIQAHKKRALAVGCRLHSFMIEIPTSGGWSQDYMQVLRSQINIDKVERIPVFWIAVWLYRDKNWLTSTNASSVVGSSCGSFTSPQRN